MHPRLRPLFGDDWPDAIDVRLLNRADQERINGYVWRMVLSGRDHRSGVGGLFDRRELLEMRRMIFAAGVMSDDRN